MRLLKGLLTTIGVIGVLVIIALVMGYYLFCLTPPIKAKIRPVVLTAEAAQSLDKKFNTLETEIEDSVNKKQKIKVSMTLTEEEVNSKFVEILAEGKLPLKEILINFNEGYIVAYAVFDNTGADAKTGVIARAEALEGAPEVIVENFELGKLPLPQNIKNGAGSLLNILVKMNVPTGSLSLEITKITISKGKLSIEGTTRVGG